MKIQDEWRMYDPKDTRTHPEGISEVEIEFEDGVHAQGLYSRDCGMFSRNGGSKPLESYTAKRWRYLSATLDSD